jgi:hypothetical protein
MLPLVEPFPFFGHIASHEPTDSEGQNPKQSLEIKKGLIPEKEKEGCHDTAINTPNNKWDTGSVSVYELAN